MLLLYKYVPSNDFQRTRRTWTKVAEHLFHSMLKYLNCENWIFTFVRHFSTQVFFVHVSQLCLVGWNIKAEQRTNNQVDPAGYLDCMAKLKMPKFPLQIIKQWNEFSLPLVAALFFNVISGGLIYLDVTLQKLLCAVYVPFLGDGQSITYFILDFVHAHSRRLWFELHHTNSPVSNIQFNICNLHRNSFFLLQNCPLIWLDKTHFNVTTTYRF